jgi:predicted transcriptional regulator
MTIQYMGTVKDIMNEPITISKDSTISGVIKKLLEQKIGRLLVSEDDKITSIITEKDICFFLLSDKTERMLDQIHLTEISQPVFSVDQSTTIKECARIMLEKGMGSVTVSSDDKIIGIVTKTDLTRYYAENFAGEKSVGEYMSPYFAWVYSDTPLYCAVDKMLNDRVSRLILRNKNETPEGILSFRDLFFVSLYHGNEEDVIDNRDADIPVVFKRHGFLSDSGFGGTTTAKQIMTDAIITVNYDEDLAKTCNVLLDNGINGVGVLSRYGTIIGILSKTDVVKCLSFIN